MKKRSLAPLAVLAALLPSTVSAERINQEGRILGPAPSVSAPVLFDTPQADAVVSALQIMPVTNAFNEDVSALPLDPNSAAIIAQINTDFVSSRRHVVFEYEMNFVLVPDTQPLVPILMTTFPDESDDTDPVTGIGTYPIPVDLPIETWPRATGTTSLTAWQTDGSTGGDRRAIMVMPASGPFWETWMTLLTTGTPAWNAANGARFDMTSNALRPDGWTSGDAAGLPMFPALVRYDECQRGVVEHALRLVVERSRGAHIYPATHQTSGDTTATRPAMGQRLRLRSSFAIPTTWDACSIAVATALKKYGGLVADNGNFFSYSVTPDERFDVDAFSGSQSILITDFEVVAATDATAGPRSPGAPTVDAGPDLTIALGDMPTLTGSATGTGITTLWYVYPYTTPPGAVTFGSPNSLVTTASFGALGDYTLMLRASDGVHAVAYDAVIVHVLPSIPDAGSDVGTGSDATSTDAADVTDIVIAADIVDVTDVVPSADAIDITTSDVTVADASSDAFDAAASDVTVTDVLSTDAVDIATDVSVPPTDGPPIRDVATTDAHDAGLDVATSGDADSDVASDGATSGDSAVHAPASGGCSCRVVGPSRAPSSIAGLVCALALLLARRRRVGTRARTA